MRRPLRVALLLAAFAAGCDRPFEPFGENGNGPYSMLGYLDLKADTQWVRVMPIRQHLLPGPEPIDAVVTLEHVESGRAVTMRDSLFAYQDARIDATAYAHVYWTTERLEAKARYRVRARRSDGAESAVLVDMPPDLELSLRNLEGGKDTAVLEVRAERVVSIETLHATSSPSDEPGGSVSKRQRIPSAPVGSGHYIISIDGLPPTYEEALRDVDRTELRVAATKADWPARDPRAGADGEEIAAMPTNVENGLGYVGAASSWTIPFHRCRILVPRPDNQPTCTTLYDARSASISGRVIRQPCARPHALGEVRLTERYADGGAVTRRWRIGWDGVYRFEGIEPGAELSLQVGNAPNAPLAAPVTVSLPLLAPGQRHAVQDISAPVLSGC